MLLYQSDDNLGGLNIDALFKRRSLLSSRYVIPGDPLSENSVCPDGRPGGPTQACYTCHILLTVPLCCWFWLGLYSTGAHRPSQPRRCHLHRHPLHPLCPLPFTITLHPSVHPHPRCPPPSPSPSLPLSILTPSALPPSPSPSLITSTLTPSVFFPSPSTSLTLSTLNPSAIFPHHHTLSSLFAYPVSVTLSFSNSLLSFHHHPLIYPPLSSFISH